MPGDLCVLPKALGYAGTVGQSAEPSKAAAEVIARVSEVLLEEPDDVMADLHEAVFASIQETFRAEPSLAAEVTASSRGNLLHWAAALRRDPGATVMSNLRPEVVGIARDAFRRGIATELVPAYHAGHNALWRHWMRLAFTVSSDPAVLEEALDVAARSMTAFIDSTVDALTALLETERAELTRGSNAQKFEAVSLVLDGAPISNQRAAERLNYRFDARHTAAVLWTDPHEPDTRVLQQAADALRSVTDAQHSLEVIASSSSMWVWLANATSVDPKDLDAAIAPIPEVRVAIGPEDVDIDGFRRSHLDAIETQRLLQRLPDLRIARFTEVQLVALVAGDQMRASDFVARTLGSLTSADPELRATLRTYIRARFSASRAAQALFAHRNTVLNRIQRAERLLPLDLHDHSLEIGVALEIEHWLGPQALASPRSRH